MKRLKDENGSFQVDIFILLPFLGLFIVFLTVRFLYKFFGHGKKFILNLAIITIALFWAISVGLYFDFFNPPRFISSLSGNDFIWNWPVYPLTGHRVVSSIEIPTYLFGGFYDDMAFFVLLFVYPFILWLGIQLGYLLFGRSEKQRGIMDLLFPRPANSKNPFN